MKTKQEILEELRQTIENMPLEMGDGNKIMIAFSKALDEAVEATKIKKSTRKLCDCLYCRAVQDQQELIKKFKG